jgi:hypothetical protein
MMAGNNGPPAEPSAIELMNRLQALAGELAVISAPALSLLTNSLDIYANRARNGDAAAQETLRQFFRALDDARPAADSIAVVRKPTILKGGR